MTTTNEESRSKIAMFDGKQRSFIFWEEKFMARIYKKKFNSIFLNTVKVPMYGTDYGEGVSTPEEGIQDDVDLNIAAYSELINSIDTSEESGKTAFHLVSKTRVKEYPNGNAYKAYMNLKTKYKPTTEIDKGELLRVFHSAELRPGAVPDNFITRT